MMLHKKVQDNIGVYLVHFTLICLGTVVLLTPCLIERDNDAN